MILNIHEERLLALLDEAEEKGYAKAQAENARLREALEMAETYVSCYEFNNEEEYTFIMNQIREALKGGE
jgi:hypothetical protein